jgi:hypothetical protein
MTAQDGAWADIAVPPGLGLEGPRYKFAQNLSHVQAFLRLPPAAAAAKKVGCQRPAAACSCARRPAVQGG